LVKFIRTQNKGMAMSRLQNKIAVVTGASRGIGRAIAQRLAADGARIIAHYGNSTKEAEALAQDLRGRGAQVELVQADLAQVGASDQLYAGVDRILKAWGATRFDILVNNAGVADWTAWTDMSEAAFDRQFAINVRALFFSTRHAIDRMNDHGRVINISSIVAEHAFPDITPYNATKGAVNTITRNFAQHLGSRGITVNSISPGATRTDMSAWLNDPAGAENAASKQALKRVGETQDIADAVAFFASDDSRWVTGQVLEVSGGWGL
jgi:3-oxoacyl-[acyl-carrier protein] reductase